VMHSLRMDNDLGNDSESQRINIMVLMFSFLKVLFRGKMGEGF